MDDINTYTTNRFKYKLTEIIRRWLGYQDTSDTSYTKWCKIRKFRVVENFKIENGMV